MKRLYRNLNVLLFCSVVMSACAGQSKEPLPQFNPTYEEFPANYRTLIARYLLAQSYAGDLKTNTAMISKPFERWGGLLRGGTIPTVCVSMENTNLLGMTGKGYFLFVFLNGQVVRSDGHTNAIILTDDMCPGFSPFHELVKG
jgi:hypothetical protein